MATLALLSFVCGDLTIDLLNPTSGFHLRSWRPNVPAYKGNGVYQDSPLADGRRLVHARRDNWLDTFSLEARDSSQDAAIRTAQDMRRLLQLAADYWTNSDPTVQPDIPYIKARAAYETNMRYAVIVAGQMAEDENPYAQPFLQPLCRAAMSNLTVAVEHLAWQSTVPGAADCVQASAQQGEANTQTTVTSAPAQSEDDGLVIRGTHAMNLAATAFIFGYGPSGVTDNFMRFPNVTVPAGATILRAYVTFTASNSDSNTDCRVQIWAEQTDNAAVWSTYENYAGRHNQDGRHPFVNWPWIDDGDPSLPAWTTPNTYTTPDLTTLIQPLVNRPGWASGNAIALFFDDNESSSTPAMRRAATWDHVTLAEPVLTVIYATSTTPGRSATCNREVYTANKHNRAQLSHAFWNSGAAWSGNLIGAATPFDLLDNPIANNDVVYFGIQTSLADSGPFSSLVFDITTAAAYTGTAMMTWQYWNGGWVTLTVQDNTAAAPSLPFSNSGVNSVHWAQPSDWTTTAINGVTGYWVRALATIAGADTISTPQHGNRNIYTICWPFLDVAAAQVGGDMPALLRELWECESSGPGLSGPPALYASTVMVGLRSLDRGAEFSAYINLCQEQNAAGILVNAVGATTTFDVDTLAPTGMAAHWNPAGAEAMSTHVSVYLDPTIAGDFRGQYHAFVRGRQSGGTAGNMEVRLGIYTGGEVVYTENRAFTTISVPQALDMGKVRIPAFESAPTDSPNAIFLLIQSSTTSGTPELYYYDVILLPVDEWAATIGSVDTTPYTTSQMIGYYNYLDLDSVLFPRLPAPAYLRYVPDDNPVNTLRVITTGPAILQSGQAQRLWHFSQHYRTTGVVRSDPEIAFRHQLYKTQRYYSSRGNR